MYFLISDVYTTKRSYSCDIELIINTIRQFNTIPVSIHYDKIRCELFIEAHKFSTVCELEKIGSTIEVTFTTYCKYRLNMPKTYTLGIIGFIEQNLKKS